MEITRRDLLTRAAATFGAAVAGSAFVSASLRADEGHADDDEHGHEDEEHGHEDEEVSSKRLRRWAMVVDLRKCDGCKGVGMPPQCTQYCNWGRFVPQGQHWVEVYEVDSEAGDDHPPHSFPVVCMQCENAPCANVCPVAATFHAPEGVVLIDQERCIGCRLCMAACPYDRRFFNWGEPEQAEWVRSAPYNVLTQTPAMRGTVMKCDFCTDKTSAGGLPMCVEGCPRGVLYFGDLEEDIATNGSEVVTLSHFIHHNNARRYKEELGTRPRVWYIPGHGELSEARTRKDGPGKDGLEWIGRRMKDWEAEHASPMSNGNGHG